MMMAAYDWSGFYIGLNGGGATSHNCWTFGGASEGCHDATGGTVGGQIGYRWQQGPVVFGVEAQGNWADFKGDNASLLFATRNQTKIDAFGLFTGQVGYAFNNVLLYVKGGAAVTDDKYNIYTLPGALLASATETRWGGVVGAGLEYGFAPNWSVGVEYDHMFMGSSNINFTAPARPAPQAPTASSRTWISSRPASTTSSAARWSRGTDLPPVSRRIEEEPRHRPGLFSWSFA